MNWASSGMWVQNRTPAQMVSVLKSTKSREEFSACISNLICHEQRKQKNKNHAFFTYACKNNKQKKAILKYLCLNHF
jgi:hypothetical protein